MFLVAGLLQACTTGDSDDPAAGSPADDQAGTADRPAAASTEVRVDIALRQTAYAADEAVIADVKITNAGSRNVKLLSWMLPADDLEESLFVVAQGGQRAAFLGAHYKRPPAEAADFVHLAAGATLTRQVDLSRFYDLARTGDYDIQLVVDDRELRPTDGPAAARVASNTVRVWIEGRTAPEIELAAPNTLAGTLSYSKCTTTQASQVAQAVSVATSYAGGALTYLGGSPSATQRYTTWFGSYSSSGWSTAKSHFTSIADAFNTKPITVDCGCKQNYYAYVYPTKPYVIYVCKVFWQAPLSGTDSKGGTLVHEMSHFNVTAGTDDWAYGQSAAKSLAISNPTNALDNADSHEYFAENTPALP